MNSPRHAVPPKSRRSELLALRTRFLAYVQTRIMSTVVVFLVTAWLGISWSVYFLEKDAQNANITTFGEGVWWGIVTFLTVGYGDRYPITTGGRFFASFLMLAGVLSVGIVTAKISSYFLEQALRQGRGIVDTERLKNHFIVCGWKEDMVELLNHILDFNPGLKSSSVVLVANIAQSVADGIRGDARLRDLQVIVGDYFQETHLKRAAPERARKILILADRTPGASGQAATMTEVDARTIMTAMTLANIARGTLVTAEILDPKMDHYLKLASVSEIIYSREYSRLLLGNASGGTGISNIIFDLLDPKTTTMIATRAIPEEFVGKPYSAFKSGFERDGRGVVVIGVLENTGNLHRIKDLALRQAQKTPDVERLVRNLKSVKELRCNNPIFNPGDTYLIPDGAMAIVIDSAGKGQGRGRVNEHGQAA